MNYPVYHRQEFDDELVGADFFCLSCVCLYGRIFQMILAERRSGIDGVLPGRRRLGDGSIG